MYVGEILHEKRGVRGLGGWRWRLGGYGAVGWGLGGIEARRAGARGLGSWELGADFSFSYCLETHFKTKNYSIF